jgi:hypothetical protein
MSYTPEDLTAWFWDFLGLGFSGRKYLNKRDEKGNRIETKSYARFLKKDEKELALFRKRKSYRIYKDKNDRQMLADKSFARDMVREGIGKFMTRRKENPDGALGTYKNERHVTYQKFKELQAANYSELIDISGVQRKLQARDSKGRFVSG